MHLDEPGCVLDKSWERLKSNPSFENEFINWETKWISHEYENQTDTHWYERLLHNYEKSKEEASQLQNFQRGY